MSAELSEEEGRGEEWAEWATAPDTLTLGKDEVHVWRASLNLRDARRRQLSYVLARDEVGRAARFHFRKDHDHFVAARVILRSLLGLYLGTNPARIRFAYNSYGKPSLEAVSGEDALHFNV